MTKLLRIVLLNCIAIMLILGVKPASAQTVADQTLKITPQNTVILNNTVYAGRHLQYFLIKFYVGEKEAESYRLDSKIDRAASPYFPLFEKAENLPTGKNVIAVGRTQYLSDEDKARLEAASANGAALLKRQGTVVVIAGSPFAENWQGDYAAMTEFLNRVCGIRFYAPGDLWISRPSSASINIDALNFFQEQAFMTSYYTQYSNPDRNKEWFRANPTTSRMRMNTNHNLANIFPPDKYGKSHPEIYELRGGERRIPTSIGTKIWNPSLVAPALPDLTMDYIREQKKKNPQLKYISLGMMDIEFHDESPAAQESVKRYGDYSNLYYEYVNEVARRAAKEFPGLVISTFAYANARKAPIGMKIESNVAVKLVTKFYRHVEPHFAEFERRRALDFAALGSKWFVHEWVFSGVSPRNYTNQYARFLQWGKQHGMLGAYVEFSPEESWYLDGAKYWVLAQILADPYQDTDLLWRTYCNDMYGAAGEEMFKLFQHFQAKYTYAPEYIELADIPRQESALFSPADLAYQRSLLNEAVAKTKNDAQIQARLAHVLRQFRAHELFAQATYLPNRLDFKWKSSGINKELLAFYVNDDGKKLAEAVQYYDTQYSETPGTSRVSDRLGARNSYINNYVRGFAKLLRTIRAEATKGYDLATLDASKTRQLNDKAKQVLRANLPSKSRPAQVKKFEAILDKSLLVPCQTQMPKIDGDLSDAAWKNAAPLVSWSERDTLLTSKHHTEGKIMRVGDKLVVGLKAKQEGPIWTQSSKETTAGTHIWRESGFEVFFGPLPAEGATTAPMAQYIVNAAGSFRGFSAARDNRKNVEVEVKLDTATNSYTVEAALPLKTDNYDYTNEKALTFNIARNVFLNSSYEGEVILGWYPIFYTVYNLESRGVIYFE